MSDNEQDHSINNNNNNRINHEHPANNMEDTDRNVRPRNDPLLVPLDPAMIDSAVMRRTVPVNLRTLMSGSKTDIPRNSRIDLQLLRVISNYNASGSNSTFGSIRVYASGYRGGSNGRGAAHTVNYTRLFLCKVVGGIDNLSLVYIMETASKNRKLWGKNVALRDDGSITIGTVFRVLNPLPIDRVMPDGGAILESRFTSIIMRPERDFPESPINFGLGGNKSYSFNMNGCILTVNSTTPEETNCSGLFCDKQRVRELMDRNQACGCYSMTTTRSNLTLDHSIHINHPNWDHCVENFSSTQFARLYMNGTFPSSIRSDSLDLTDAYYNLTDCIERCVDLINDNGGFTVTGWYKRGVINDRSIVGAASNGPSNSNSSNNNSDSQVDNGEINFHPCLIQPTNRNFLVRNNNLKIALDLLKYNVTTMNADGQPIDA